MTLRVQEIAAAAIVPSPHNPRQLRDGDPGIASLAESIKAQGLIQPITVRHRLDADGDRYEIVAGERRWRACRLAGLETVPAIVRTDLDDQQALELIVTENLQREDLHPLEEAKGVASLVTSGHDYRAVADRLGKSLGWVARRARLATLSPKWRALAADSKSPVSGWPASRLELVARLEPPAQDEFLASLDDWQLEDIEHEPGMLQRSLAEYTRELKFASWKLDDATLDPRAGACTSCPKRSSCHPGLFDDEESPAKKANPGDRCLDAVCWNEKARRFLARKLDELESAGRVVALAPGDGLGIDDQVRELAGDRRVVRLWEGSDAKKSDPEAVAVLVANGASAGQVRYRRLSSAGASASSSREASSGQSKPKPLTLAEKRAKLAARRQAHALEAICEAVKKSTPPALHNLVALAAAFGTDLNADRPGPIYDGGSGNAVPMKIFAGSNHENRLWTLVARVLVRRWRNALSWHGQKGLAEHEPEIAAVAKALELDLAPFEAKAAEAIPEPKAWAAEAAKSKAAKKAGGKRKAA